MKTTRQQQESFEKLRDVCPEVTMAEMMRIDNSDVLVCDNFAPADDRKAYIHEYGRFIFWIAWIGDIIACQIIG